MDLSVLTREPVRTYLYTVVSAVVALLVGVGVVTGTAAPLVLGVAAAVLAVPGVEGARRKVTPMKKLDTATRSVVEKGERG